MLISGGAQCTVHLIKSRTSTPHSSLLRPSLYPSPFSFDPSFGWSNGNFVLFTNPIRHNTCFTRYYLFSTALPVTSKWLVVSTVTGRRNRREYLWRVTNMLKFRQNMKKEHFDDIDPLFLWYSIIPDRGRFTVRFWRILKFNRFKNGKIKMVDW